MSVIATSRKGFKEQFDQNGVPFVEIPKKTSTKSDRKFAGSGLGFGQSPNDETFAKLHLAISKPVYEGLKESDHYTMSKEGFSVRPVLGADAKTLANLFIERLKKVEPSLGWANRYKYQPENLDSLVAEIAEDFEDSMILDFYDGDTHVGFTKISGITVNWNPRDHEKGLDKYSAVTVFARQEELKKAPNPIEIDKFAMFPNSMGRGFGKCALASTLDYLFEQRGYNVVYLDTRTTNPAGTEDFYQKLGLRAFCYEKLKNDLAKPVGWPPKHGVSDIRYIAGYVGQSNGSNENIDGGTQPDDIAGPK